MVKLQLPANTITDPFAWRDWFSTDGWAAQEYSYRPLHAGIDYRMGNLYAPCDAVVYCEHIQGVRGADYAIYIIPTRKGKPVDHTIIYIRHRRVRPYDFECGVWYPVKRGDLITNDLHGYGGYAPHTHLEVNCTPDAPLVRRMLRGDRNPPATAPEVVDIAEQLAREHNLLPSTVRAKVAHQVNAWGIEAVAEGRYMVSTKWNKGRWCKVSRVGKTAETYRVNPLLAGTLGVL